MFLNVASTQCECPESVDRNVGPSLVKTLKQRPYLYLSFDDGPSEGTPNVLRALKVNVGIFIH